MLHHKVEVEGHLTKIPLSLWAPLGDVGKQHRQIIMAILLVKDARLHAFLKALWFRKKAIEKGRDLSMAALGWLPSLWPARAAWRRC